MFRPFSPCVREDSVDLLDDDMIFEFKRGVCVSVCPCVCVCVCVYLVPYPKASPSLCVLSLNAVLDYEVSMEALREVEECHRDDGKCSEGRVS